MDLKERQGHATLDLQSRNAKARKIEALLRESGCSYAQQPGAGHARDRGGGPCKSDRRVVPGTAVIAAMACPCMNPMALTRRPPAW